MRFNLRLQQAQFGQGLSALRLFGVQPRFATCQEGVDYLTSLSLPFGALTADEWREINEPLLCELPDGGWTLTGGEPDVDITAMTLQALAKYREQLKIPTTTLRKAL